MESTERRPQPARRDFLKATTAGAAAVALSAAVPANVHAAGSDVLRVGLVGCGGRGSGAAMQAMAAGEDVRLVALGDVFEDRLRSARQNLSKEAGRFAVDDDHCFVGWDAYKNVIDSVDVVLLATPPHFRPMHLEAAVAAGKHVFCEKPMAVDAPGVRRVLEACRLAKEKNLAVVSGFCYRYNPPTRELMKRVHDGAIGDVVAVHVVYNAGGLWMHPRQEGWSDMEWQLRNWLYFTWLSGDHIVEQHVHSIDTACMFLQDRRPVAAVSLAGRQARTEPEYGHIYDHHSVVYEYDDGVRVFAQCRQQPGTDGDVSDWAFGTKGRAVKRAFNYHVVEGENKWKFRGPSADAYLTEHLELFASIREGRPINDGESMAQSTMMAVLGRMAGYTGKRIRWEQALESKEVLGPEKYEFGPLPVPPVAVPGKTPFV